MFNLVDLYDIINGQSDEVGASLEAIPSREPLRRGHMACSEVCAIFAAACCDVFSGFLIDFQSIRMCSSAILVLSTYLAHLRLWLQSP